MSAIDRIMERISQHNVPDSEILQLMNIADNFAQKYKDKPEVLEKVAQAKAVMSAKMGNKELALHEEPLHPSENTAPKTAETPNKPNQPKDIPANKERAPIAPTTPEQPDRMLLMKKINDQDRR